MLDGYIEKVATQGKTELEQIKIRYGLQLLIGTISKTILFSIIALYLGIFDRLLVVLITGILVRSMGGGLHFKSNIVCTIYSFTMYFIPLYAYKYLMNKEILLLFLAVCFALTYLYAPVESSKNIIKEPKKYKTALYMFLVMLSISVFILPLKYVSLSVTMTLITCIGFCPRLNNFFNKG